MERPKGNPTLLWSLDTETDPTTGADLDDVDGSTATIGPTEDHALDIGTNRDDETANGTELDIG